MIRTLTASLALIAAGCATAAAPTPAFAETQKEAAMPAPVKSVSDFASTDARLAAAIDTRGLTLFTVVDHAAGAAKVDLELAPNKLYIFGNPKAGTPLMQANPQAGLDLPLKALVYETSDGVYVLTSDIDGIFEARGIDGLAPVRGNVSKALAGIAAEAAGLTE